MQNTTNNSKSLAVVTGASSGIGYELAKQFAENGYDLIVAAESDGLQESAARLEAMGAQVIQVQTDLSKPAGVDQLWQAIQATGRPLEAAAINAGVGAGGATFAEIDLDKQLNIVDLNVRSVVQLAHYVINHMKTNRRGKILFTASIAATMPGPFEAVYAASKSFVLSFSEAVRNELKDSGVSVTALMPGPTATNFFHRAGMDDTKAGAKEEYDNDPADVARMGYEALMKGDDKVIASNFKVKVQTAIAGLMGQETKAAMHRGSTEPGFAEKQEKKAS